MVTLNEKRGGKSKRIKKKREMSTDDSREGKLPKTRGRAYGGLQVKREKGEKRGKPPKKHPPHLFQFSQRNGSGCMVLRSSGRRRASRVNLIKKRGPRREILVSKDVKSWGGSSLSGKAYLVTGLRYAWRTRPFKGGGGSPTGIESLTT